MTSPILSSGSLYFDQTLKSGGIPRGEVVVVQGDEESGKTTLCLMLAAAVTQLGENVVWIDADWQCDPKHVLSFRIDPHYFFLHRSELLQPTLELIEQLINSQAISLLVIDSITSLLGKSLEYFEDPQTKEMDQAEKQFALWLPVLVNLLHHTGCVMIITERTHRKPGTIYHGLKGHLSRLALPLRAGLRIIACGVHPLSFINPNQGIRLQIRMLRGKLVKSISTTEIILLYNQGVEKNVEIFQLGVNSELIRFQEGVFLYKGQPIGSNREEVIHFLQKHLEVAQEIERDIRKVANNTFHLVK